MCEQGRRLEEMLPDLTNELGRIADALERQNELKAIELGVKPLKEVAKEFVDGEASKGST